MPVTRLFSMGLQKMLSDVVRAVVASDPTLVLVGESTTVDFGLAARSEADLVVVPLDRFTDAELDRFLRTHCGTGLLGLAGDAMSATLYEMRPHRTALGELGVEALAAALTRTPGGR